MIHVCIFVVPKPGMSESDFFRYWTEVHAPLGRAIPQVLGYRINMRMPFDGLPVTDPYRGLADVWLEDIASLVAFSRSTQYIEGARADEPNWLSFWQMSSLATQEHVLVPGSALAADSELVKLVAMVKRKPGMSRPDFRRHSLETHGVLDAKLPGLRRYVQSHACDAEYLVGEPPWDCISELWFDDAEAVARALRSAENSASAADLGNFVNPRYAHAMLVKERWVVGPKLRNPEAARLSHNLAEGS